MDTHPNYRVLDLFSGYGGFALGLRLAGLDATTVASESVASPSPRVFWPHPQDVSFRSMPVYSRA